MPRAHRGAPAVAHPARYRLVGPALGGAVPPDDGRAAPLVEVREAEILLAGRPGLLDVIAEVEGRMVHAGPGSAPSGGGGPPAAGHRRSGAGALRRRARPGGGSRCPARRRAGPVGAGGGERRGGRSRCRGGGGRRRGCGGPGFWRPLHPVGIPVALRRPAPGRRAADRPGRGRLQPPGRAGSVVAARWPRPRLGAGAAGRQCWGMGTGAHLAARPLRLGRCPRGGRGGLRSRGPSVWAR